MKRFLLSILLFIFVSFPGACGVCPVPEKEPAPPAESPLCGTWSAHAGDGQVFFHFFSDGTYLANLPSRSLCRGGTWDITDGVLTLAPAHGERAAYRYTENPLDDSITDGWGYEAETDTLYFCTVPYT